MRRPIPVSRRLSSSAPESVSKAFLDAYPVAKMPGNVDSACMEGQSASPRRRERVVFETDRHLVVGDVTLPPEGYQSRLSDAVNRADVTFIPLLDVEISPLGGGEAKRRSFILLAKEHIRLAHPVDESR